MSINSPLEPTGTLATALRRSRRNRRWFTIAATCAVVAGAIAGCAASAADHRATPDGATPAVAVAELPSPGADGGPTASTPAPTTSDPAPTDASTDESTAPSSEDSTDAGEDALDAADDSEGLPDSGGDVGQVPDDHGDDTADNPVDLDPVGDGTPTGPCTGVDLTNGQLYVTPDPAVLADGQLASSLTITNCGEGDVDWTAATKPTVTLSNAGGNLAAGSSSMLGFTIDAGAYEPGAITFKIKVSEAGHNHYVDVFAFRPTFGSDLLPNLGLSAGADAGGCANQCIVKAWLTPNFTTPNIGLEVQTDTPATIRAFVSTQAPVADDASHPLFPGKPATATSNPGSTEWTANLAPLQPATKYYLIVKATDANGKSSYRSTSFTTITPVDNPGGLVAPGVEPGCAAQCITSAQVTAGGDVSIKHLAVKSHTPAQFQVWVDDSEPEYHDGKPSFDHADVWVPSGVEYIEGWSTDIAGLAAATEYHIIVLATDVNGHQSYRAGAFHTAAEPTVDVVITFHEITVLHDGDSSPANRGELSFAWGVGDTVVGTAGEDKLGDGATISIPEWKDTYVVTDAAGFLPTVYVSGAERDADGLFEFCSVGPTLFHEDGFDEGCDLTWNAGSSGIMTVDSIDSLPACSTFGIGGNWADVPCLLIETPTLSAGYPTFTAVVSFYIPA